ncbi:MAG: hypothetical protein Q8R07_03560, partial [Candidatus Uhrbacteria bacterium]|nr:hypothetical protein [Candidatus Uhrbacteria bacterium]
AAIQVNRGDGEVKMMPCRSGIREVVESPTNFQSTKLQTTRLRTKAMMCHQPPTDHARHDVGRASLDDR